jgi:glucans biosynthesis protein C
MDKTLISHQTQNDLLLKINRLFYLDWLRVIAVFIVFIHHCSRIFDYQSYVLKSNIKSFIANISIGFFQLWMMPLLFIISGAGVYYSLKSRKAAGFIKERFLRILIPFLFIGLFIISPPQVYLHRLSNAEFNGNFFQFYPYLFSGLYPHGNFPIQGMHLWYLQMLFVYSLVLLPIFIPFGKNRISLISRLSFLFEKPLSLVLLFIPLAIVGILMDIIGARLIFWKSTMGGWDGLTYMILFIYGYLIFPNNHIVNSIKRYSTIFLIISLVLTTPCIYLEMSFDSLGSNHPIWFIVIVLRAFLSWSWLIAILGFGIRFLNFNNKYLAYTNEAVFPFYILHQTILVIIGFYVIQWNISIALKYVIIAVSSFIAIMIIYEVLVKRLNIFRFLFGMKKLKKT